MEKWVNVNERLPEKDGKYLVFCKYNGVILISAFTTNFYKIREEVGLDCDETDIHPAWYEDECYPDEDYNYFRCERTHITHWMPLPDAP